MKPEISPRIRELLKASRIALNKGDREGANRLARQAVKLAPKWEVPWLFLAASSPPEEGLTYIARALEINPESKQARKAIRWHVHRMPPGTQQRTIRQVQLPAHLTLKLSPFEALTRKRLLSL